MLLLCFISCDLHWFFLSQIIVNHVRIKMGCVSAANLTTLTTTMADGNSLGTGTTVTVPNDYWDSDEESDVQVQLAVAKRRRFCDDDGACGRGNGVEGLPPIDANATAEAVPGVITFGLQDASGEIYCLVSVIITKQILVKAPIG